MERCIRENNNREKMDKKNMRCGTVFGSDKGEFEGKSIRCTRSWLCGDGSRVPHSITIRLNWSERHTQSGCCFWRSYSDFFVVVVALTLRRNSFLCCVCCYVCLCIPLLSKFFGFSSFFLLRYHCYRFDCADFDCSCVCCRIPYYFY